MGKVSKKKLILSIACFIIVSIFVYRAPVDKPLYKKSKSLRIFLNELPGWKNGGDILLSGTITEALKLDDYIFRRYVNEKNIITLYIGYYFSNQKVGAAHDPLVCFPGQGWALSDHEKGRFILEELNQAVNYRHMVASRSGTKEYLIYWFQAFDQSLTTTLAQKVSLFKSQIIHNRGDNAFIRLSITLKGQTEQDILKVSNDFVRVMYPRFMQYVNY